MIYTKPLNINSVEQEWVRAIYESSFPIDERRDFKQLVELLSDNKSFVLDVVCDEQDVIGMLSSWQLDEWRYVEHFAIEATKRGAGVGREVLHRFIMRDDRPVVLEVEPPTDLYSTRRIAFYRSMGFVLHAHHRYVQPPYGEGREPVELVLMTYGAPSECNLNVLTRLLHTSVYGIK